MSGQAGAAAKWFKYLILEQFGLLPEEEISGRIKRYSRAELDCMIDDLRKDLYREEQLGRRNLFVIKLVPRCTTWGLPNLRVESKGDILRIPRFLQDHEQRRYEEAWYCWTRIDEGAFSVAGRFVFAEKKAWSGQLVEQVWRCSPRLLEYLSDGFGYAYVRANRPSWRWAYRIEEVRLPRKWPGKAAGLKRDFFFAMELIERERERICEFLEFLDGCGYTTYSLEYKIVGSRVAIIDWDTPNDAVALNRFFAAGALYARERSFFY